MLDTPTGVVAAGEESVGACLQVRGALAPGTKDAHGQIADLLGELLFQHSERAVGVTRDEHPPTGREAVADEVGDRVGLARSWWTLDHHPASPREFLEDLVLLRIGGQRKERTLGWIEPRRARFSVRGLDAERSRGVLC